MSVNRIHQRIDQDFDEHLARLQELLRIPSISRETSGLRAAARWLGDFISQAGGKASHVGREEAPIVLGRFECGRPKTLLVYGQYDVHPARDDDAGWTSPPFGAEIHPLPGVGPAVIGRGACNSKGPLLGFLNAVRTMWALDALPVNLILTIEGEEEEGTPTLESFYRDNVASLAADAGFEPFWAQYGTDTDRPMLALGTKGIVVVELRCRGGDWGGPTSKSLHSSVGGWLASPAWRLITALASVIDRDENIKIESFDEHALPPAETEERQLRELAASFDEASTLRVMAARRFKGDLHAADLLRRYLFSPSISIGALSSVDPGEIPPRASAQLAIRIVPEMTTQEVVSKLRRHLDSQGFSDIELLLQSSYEWSRTELAEPVVQSMLATYRAYGCDPQIWPRLASATPYYLFSQVLGLPYVAGGLGVAGGSHSTDEFAAVDGLRTFEKSIATFLSEFGRSNT